jgi:hypothetical protein
MLTDVGFGTIKLEVEDRIVLDPENYDELIFY